MADIYLTNTLTGKKEKFEPINPSNVGVYSCGPTVYDNQHIGNMYAFIQWDVLVRLLRYQGFKVKWVMNITDVGHMTSNQDEGEDKVEKGAKKEGITIKEVVEKYTKQFLESIDFLNIQRPDVLPKATDHIQEQIEMIKKIEENGFTYKTKTGLVFDTSKFKKYPDFAHLDLEKQKAGARIEVDPEKKSPWDFLLWVTNQPEHAMQWESPWGKGFPGWHIECTAMSTKYLGEQFDIHTGGREHIPVHHTNEIAQAYGAFKKATVRYWLHNDWLTLKNEEMSKSLGNVVLVTDLIDKGFDPMEFRYLVLSSHYRKGLVFSWESLEAARNGMQRLRDTIVGLREETRRTTLSEEKQKKVDNYREKFLKAISDDLNTPKALAVLWEMLKSNVPSEDKYDLAISFDEVLGLSLQNVKYKKRELPATVEKLVKDREVLRKSGKFEEADELRKSILKEGYLIEDTPKGFRIKKVKQ